ncbi:hypothetical protein DICSQDRAFT_172231 [Dichomitus squalens LYAD-421 SS1]|uniref:Uncharacterized protein n=1 Tax=Dichomitus squalens (strain LYAD-421) TaxID=732165 RepID=R7STM3_DICSQ|nr:uncharacterized protein DICSQDRAFT_172231 [Dichomitus squalens LYAD-421 SS1]EJF59248.1 hypothetical protein DICSQDRAFT_172231 [Dichomitus squalens LYAD-421 SS1]
MPSPKFQSPANSDTIAPDTGFPVTIAIDNLAIDNPAIDNLDTAHFTSSTTSFHMPPHHINAHPHSHIIVQHTLSLPQTTPTHPTKRVFANGLHNVAVNGRPLPTVSRPSTRRRLPQTHLPSARREPAMPPSSRTDSTARTTRSSSLSTTNLSDAAPAAICRSPADGRHHGLDRDVASHLRRRSAQRTPSSR